MTVLALSALMVLIPPLLAIPILFICLLGSTLKALRRFLRQLKPQAVIPSTRQVVFEKIIVPVLQILLLAPIALVTTILAIVVIAAARLHLRESIYSAVPILILGTAIWCTTGLSRQERAEDLANKL